MNRTEYMKQYNKKYHVRCREFIAAAKIQRGACVMCGLVCTDQNYVAFDFDHRDQDSKFRSVSHCQTINRAAQEIDKCDLLCANCHRIKTWREEAWRGGLNSERKGYRKYHANWRR